MLKGEVRIALAGLILAFGIPVHSLAQSTFGAIVGTVRDATGATVADATVKLENLNESTVREAKTSLDGNYEALNLKPADVDQARGTIRVLHGKGDHDRTVAIDDGALAVVQLWLAERARLDVNGRQRLFCTLQGGPLSANQGCR